MRRRRPVIPPPTSHYIGSRTRRFLKSVLFDAFCRRAKVLAFARNWDLKKSGRKSGGVSLSPLVDVTATLPPASEFRDPLLYGRNALDPDYVGWRQCKVEDFQVVAHVSAAGGTGQCNHTDLQRKPKYNLTRRSL